MDHLHVPELLYQLSWTESVIGTAVAVLGLTFVGYRQGSLGVAKWLFFAASVGVLVISIGGIVAELRPSAAASAEAAGVVATDRTASGNPIAAFYAHPIGIALGSIGLLIARLAALPLMVFIVVTLLIRRRRVHSLYRKRCSNCHHIFPGNTMPHAHCPHCGVYWQYER